MAEASRFLLRGMEFSVLHEESSFLVVNKPTGLLSQSTFGVDSLLVQLRRSSMEQSGTNQTAFFELPHRLDRGTSGILLVAKNNTALRHFGAQFHTRKIHKTYLVAVAGCPAAEEDVWIDRMRKIPDVAKAELTGPNDPEGREAKLRYRCVFRNATSSVHCVEMETGRMHQIRLQFASRGYPVLGDKLYGSRDDWYPARRHDHDEHFALHAAKIVFRHPKDGREVMLEAPLPEAWEKILDFRFVG